MVYANSLQAAQEVLDVDPSVDIDAFHEPRA